MSLFLFSFAYAANEVVSPHFIIIYEDSAYDKYAQSLANEAEQALQVLAEVFSTPKNRIIINLDGKTDSFNAFATPIPRPTMTFRPLYSGRFSSLYTVIVHELTHIKQLGFNEGVHGKAGLLFGLDFGLAYRDIAALPPVWFIEGIAVWMESQHGINGRLNTAGIRQLLDSLALGPNWPNLEDLSVADQESWPAGAARYYLGVAFIDYLVSKYGFEKIVDLLKNYNGSFLTDSFSQNWQKVTGSSLYKDYQDWSEQTKQSAQSRLEKSQKEHELSSDGWYKGALSFSTDAKHISYSHINPEKHEYYLMVADYDGHKLSNKKIVSEFVPRDVSWLDSEHLLYNRFAKGSDGGDYLDLFTLDINTGDEKRLSNRARAQFPQAYEGCVYYAQNLVSSGSKILKLCEQKTETVFNLPKGSFVNSLDISPRGRIAFSIVYDNVEDIAILKDNDYELITKNHNSTQPHWQGESRIVFVSEQSGIENLFSLDLLSNSLTRLSDSFGGVLKFDVDADKIVYFSYSGSGIDLFGLEPLHIPASFKPKAIPKHISSHTVYPSHEYNPLHSLEPYGWLPSFGVSLKPLGLGLGATVLGTDYSLKHSYSLSTDYDFALNRFSTSLNYRYTDRLNLAEVYIDYSEKKGVQFELSYQRNLFFAEYTSRILLHTAGEQGNRLSFGISAGVRRSLADGSEYGFDLHSDAFSENDEFRVFTRVGANYYHPIDENRLFGELGFGFWFSMANTRPKKLDSLIKYRIDLYKYGLKAKLFSYFDYNYSFNGKSSIVNYSMFDYILPIKLRYDDGLYGLEKIRIDPILISDYDVGNDNLSFNSSLNLSADFMLFYNLPISFGIKVPLYNSGFSLGIGSSFDGEDFNNLFQQKAF